MKSTFSGKLTCLPGKIRRELLRIPYLGDTSKQRYWHRIDQYKSHLPELNHSGQTIVTQLAHRGCAIFKQGQLGLPLDQFMIDDRAYIVRCLKNKRHSALEKHQELFRNLFLWGLQDYLLDIVTNYLGLPPLYLGLVYRHDRADGQETYFRQWHRDPEDYRVVKVFVYLNPVDLAGGPFEYIERAATPTLDQALGYSDYRCGYIDSQLFKAVVPENKWVSCVGDAGTVVISDTRAVFHRQRPVEKRDRLSLTYCYTSRDPLQYFSEYSSFHQYLDGYWHQLNQRQRDCLQSSLTRKAY